MVDSNTPETHSWYSQFTQQTFIVEPVGYFMANHHTNAL